MSKIQKLGTIYFSLDSWLYSFFLNLRNAFILMFLFTIQKYLEPVYFYIYSIYGLHGGLFSCVFLISWVLSGTWVAGILAAAFYVFNRQVLILINN